MKKYIFTRKNKNNKTRSKNKNNKKYKINKSKKYILFTRKNKNNSKKSMTGGTLFLLDNLDETLKGIVSIGFEFESESSCYIMYDKNKNEYYLGDTYFAKNGRQKDDKLFQIHHFNSSNTSIKNEEFYSQEDENSSLSWLNEYFQEQLRYYLETTDANDYADNKYFVEKDAIKIMQNGEISHVITEVSDEPAPLSGEDFLNYLNYKRNEYVITFFSIEANKNPLMYYLKIALNMLDQYFKYIEQYNYNYNNPNITIMMEGSRPEYDVHQECKLYKIPSDIYEYILSDKERHSIEMGEETIYDPESPNKIISNIQYNYLMEENVKLTDIKFSPQVTIGVNPTDMIHIAKKLINSPNNKLFEIGLNLVEHEIIERGSMEFNQFDKNILIYVFYCSTTMYDQILYNEKIKYIFKYMVLFLIRHKMSDFKIFTNVNFIHFIMESYEKLVTKVDEFDELLGYYYLILLIANDAYYAKIDNIVSANDGTLSDNLHTIEENSALLNTFLRNIKNLNNNKNNKMDEFITKYKKIYSTWNDMMIKQYPYVETELHDTPLLFEIRFFNTDIYQLGYDYRILDGVKPKAMTIQSMVEIASRVEDELRTVKRPAESIEQIIPNKRKKLQTKR